ncbi:MAG: hypothetical protein WAV40_02750 [Microgenomates group bacterium]
MKKAQKNIPYNKYLIISMAAVIIFLLFLLISVRRIISVAMDMSSAETPSIAMISSEDQGNSTGIKSPVPSPKTKVVTPTPTPNVASQNQDSPKKRPTKKQICYQIYLDNKKWVPGAMESVNQFTNLTCNFSAWLLTPIN